MILRMRHPEPAPDFGARMKRLREGRGMSLRDIAGTTKISVAALEALERDDVSRLPGGIFSRAIVRAYAEEIGANPEKTVNEFIVRFPVDSAIASPGDARPYGGAEAVVRHVSRRAMVVAILLAIALVLLWSFVALG